MAGFQGGLPTGSESGPAPEQTQGSSAPEQGTEAMRSARGAVIYCRVSTKEQATNLSLPTQLRECREYCKREGFEISREFTDAGESAKTTDRPEFLKLIAYCQANRRQVQFVVIYNISRLSRNVNDFVGVKTFLRTLGTSVRSATEPIADDSAGSLVGNVLASFAQWDNDQKAERTKVGMRAALELGRWTFKAPLGYLNAGAKTSPSLRHDPARANLIRLAFAQVAEGKPVADVLRQVNAAGLLGAGGRPLSLQSFRSLLRNPIYAGLIEIPKWNIRRQGDFPPSWPKGYLGKSKGGCRGVRGSRWRTREIAKTFLFVGSCAVPPA